MQNLLFANQQRWANVMNPRNMFEEYAKNLGLDVEKFTNDSLGSVAKTRVDTDIKRGNALSIASTPTVYLNGKSIQYNQLTVQSLKQLIDAEIEKTEPKKEEESKSDDNTSDKKDDSSDKSDKKEEKKSDDKKDENEKDKSEEKK